MLRKILIIAVWAITVFLFSFPSEAANSKGFEKVAFKKEQGDFVLIAEYPKFNPGKIPSAALSRINEETERFAKQQIVATIKELQGAQLSLEERKAIGGAFENTKNSSGMTFEVIRADDQYVSVKFEKYVYFVGAAHGMTHISVFNYDVKRQKRLLLEDLFEGQADHLTLLSEIVIKDLTRQLGKPSESWIKDGAAPGKETYSVFSIGLKNITIYFQPYQVACYAAGAPKVKIPFSKLSGLRFRK